MDKLSILFVFNLMELNRFKLKNMAKSKKIIVQGSQIGIILRKGEEDFISLTDIAKLKNKDAPADVVKNWMRSRSSIEFIGLWEKISNPDFKLVEFDRFKNESGSNNAHLLSN